MTFPKLITASLTAIICAMSGAYAKQSLPLESVNKAALACYNLVEKSSKSSPVTVSPCSLVIDNAWTPKGHRSAALLNRGIIHWNQKDFKKAERDMKKALRIDTNLFQAHIVLAQMYATNERLKEAYQHYAIAHNLDNSNAAVVRNQSKVKKLLKTQMLSQQSQNKNTIDIHDSDD